MTAKKTTKPAEQPVAANAGPTVAETDPKTGETHPVEPPSTADAKKGHYTPAEGAAARMATMTPTHRNEGGGQLDAVANAKKG